MWFDPCEGAEDPLLLVFTLHRKMSIQSMGEKKLSIC
jgi:hypothetical protein